ncbi:MAG TPA: PASTA domain-containing protein, partial [Actinomycetota bacterium]|nr:PASTA domain-containing protein [Actinomycetota bacterium]
RDIKPENILVTPDGVTKVADFGLARALAESTTTHAPGTVTGTVQYLAPEQVQGEPSDPRTDLYAVGIVLFELLTGHVPFTGETSLAIAYKHLSSRVPAPSKLVAGITPAIDRIVLQATEKDREKRPPSASRMRKDLVRAATSLPPARPVGEVVGDMPASDIVPEDRAPTVTIPRTLSKRTKRRRALRRALWRVAIVAVVILGMWATWTFAVPHRVEVPRLVGLGVPAAARAAEDAGLQVEVTREVHSSSVPDGQIISQDPAAGARIERGSTISLVRSLGPDLRQVPPVEGRDRETAVRLLREAGFVVKVERAFDETAAPGTVIDQDPGAGSSYERGRTVTITVSRGRPFVDVPSVVGETRESAVALLSSANLEFTEREAFSGAVEQGRVISQSPDGGTNVREGETVTIVVSKGPRVFPMPNVVGKSEAQARSQLEDMGLEVRTVQVPGSLGGSVVSQVPEPGTQVEQGDRVTIYVA